MPKEFFINQLQKGPLLGGYSDIVEFSGIGDKIIIAASTGRKLKIHKLFLIGSGASTLKFWSGPSSENTPLSGSMPFGAAFGLAIDGDEFPLITLAGKAFVISSSVNINVGGFIVWTAE